MRRESTWGGGWGVRVGVGGWGGEGGGKKEGRGIGKGGVGHLGLSAVEDHYRCVELRGGGFGELRRL